MRRPAATAAAPTAANETIPLTVPKGTPLQVALSSEVRVQSEGQPIKGRTVEPVYAFDKLVIPAGARVTGKITKIEGVAGKDRTFDALNADFTPARKARIEFDEIVLPGGRRIPIHTRVTPGSGQTVEFVTSAQNDKQKKGAGDAASRRAKAAEQQAKQAWASAMKQVKAPDKIHRLERYALAELPVHTQFIDAGSVYYAELQEPLDFGSEPLTADLASSFGAPPADGSAVHARLVTALSSATSHTGDEAEAVVSQPLFDAGRLVVPEGSILKGTVLQVQPARSLGRNGELRIVFHELSLPNGIGQKVEAQLAGVESGQAENVKLDSEGGAHSTAPKTRYLETAVSIGIAAVSAQGDADAKGADPAGNTSNRVIGGAGGFKLVGMALGATVHSRVFGYSMGAYGAGMSVYTHFLARGRDVVFPKDTAMEIEIASRPASAPAPTRPE